MLPLTTLTCAAVRLTLLGSFDVTADDGSCIDLPTPAQRLVAYLALQERPVARLHAAGVLWLDATEARAAGSLRSAVWRIRRSGHELVEATTREIRLAPDVAVDVRETVCWARRIADPAHDPRPDDIAQAVRTADLLPDWYDDWVLAERERLRQLRLHALETLCRRLLGSGRCAEAMDVAQAAVREEPLRESARRAVIQVHLAEGNSYEAVREYRRFSSLLRDQLGLAPSHAIQSLLRPFEAHHDAVAADADQVSDAAVTAR